MEELCNEDCFKCFWYKKGECTLKDDDYKENSIYFKLSRKEHFNE